MRGFGSTSIYKNRREYMMVEGKLISSRPLSPPVVLPSWRSRIESVSLTRIYKVQYKSLSCGSIRFYVGTILVIKISTCYKVCQSISEETTNNSKSSIILYVPTTHKYYRYHEEIARIRRPCIESRESNAVVMSPPPFLRHNETHHLNKLLASRKNS